MNNKSEKTGEPKGRGGLVLGAALAGAFVLVAVFLLKNGSGPSTSGDQKVSSASSSNEKNEGAATKAGKTEVATQKGTGSAQVKGSSVKELVAQLLKPNLPATEQQATVTELVKLCSAESLAALKEALASGPPELRKMIAESLRECSSSDAHNLLLALLSDKDEAVAGAAIRSLAAQGTPEATTALAELLNNNDASASLRAEAALGLGEINQPGVTDILARAAHEIKDEDVVGAVLHALAGGDFAQTQAFFQTYLHSPDVSSDLRVAAVEAIATAQGDPSQFLADLLNDPDADVRTAVGWALSATETSGNVGKQLIAILQNESDPDVRLRLYQALRNQEDFDIPTVLGLVRNEQSPAAQVAGFDLLAKTVRDRPTPELQDYFTKVAIPALVQMALSPESFDQRQTAVLALTRSRLPAAQEALAKIGAQLAAQNAPPQTAPPIPTPGHP